MKSHYLILMFVLLIASHVQGQVVIGPVDGVDPEARLDIRTGSESSGMMIPRVNNFPSGSITQGMMVFYTGSNFDQSLYVYVDNTWQQLAESAGLDITAPSAPTSLTASNPTTSSIDLSWTASTANDVTGYYIYFSDTTLAATVTSGTSTTITGLTSGTSYTFYATAYDAAANESTVSNNASETTTSCGGIIHQASFETNADGWVLYSGAVRSTDVAFQGIYSVKMNGNYSDDGAEMELTGLDFTQYSSVTIDFRYRTSGYDNNGRYPDKVELWFKFGNSWYLMSEHGSSNGSWTQVSFTYNDGSDIAQIGAIDIAGDASSSSELVYIDDVVITAICN